MATIPLRSYLHEIEGLIESGRVDEAIAHCRHILKTYPKYIATYRLLGKAYLESQRYGDAADVFQRVHSALPDDFVSHVGMSIIREDEGNLDAALWHMERAFESQPYNTVIQDELRRLYGRRDGMEPPKVRLTRGALARMYAKGDLYQQAIGELRAALAEDPQRPDLQTLLARTYYLAGQRVPAVETCSALLKKLPYCLEANLILAAILPETERAQDAQAYRQRVLTLDPYFIQAAPRSINADSVPDHVVATDRLDYILGQVGSDQAEAQPAWASSLGVAFKGPSEEALPEWLSPTGEEETAAKVEGVEALGGVSPFGEAPAEQAEAIPDWMKEAGWSPTTGEAQEGLLAIEEGGEAGTGEAAPAQIPDWLQQMAPQGAAAEELPSQSLEGLGQEEALPWLQEAQPGASDTIVTWLGEKGEQVAPAQPSVPPIQPPTGAVPAGAAPAEEIPDWMREMTQAGATAPSAAEALEGEIPDWMREFEAEPKTPAAPPVAKAPAGLAATAAAEALPPIEAGGQAVPADLPDWLKGAMPAQEAPSIPQAEAAPAEDLPGWLKEEVVTPPPVKPSAVPADEYPAWLKEVEAEIPEEAVPSVQVIGVTDWLKTVESEIPGEAVSSEQATGITDWLKQVEQGAEGESADKIPEWLVEDEEEAPAAADVIALPASMDLSDQQATLAWLEGLAAKQGVPEEELITKPEERVEAPPAMVQETAAAEVIPMKPVAEIPAAPVEELPEWLREIEAEVPAEEAPTQISAPPPIVEIPTPAEAAAIPAGVDLSDERAALAWLESLAAKQGVPEEELITKPEERVAVPPAWVRETAAAEEIPAVPEAEISAVPAEEIPEWLKAVEAEVPAEEAPTQISAPPPVAEIPAPAEAAAVPAGVDLSDEQAALAWLESLAAKQGVPEEELITKPEERVAVPPAWVQEVAAAELEAPAMPVVEAVPFEEKPQWLKDAEAEAAAVEEAPIPVEAEAAPAAEAVIALPAAEWIPETELPDWLKETEALEAAQAMPEAVPAIPVEVEVPAAVVEEVALPVAEVTAPPPMVDINEASLGELERLPALGFSKAESILDYRQAHGPFESVEDLKRVPGIGPATLQDLAGLITVRKKKVAAPVEEGGDPYLAALKNARHALSQGDTAGATNYYSKCLKKALFLDEIILDLQDALYRFPVDVSVWKTLGDAYVRNNQLQDALDAYTKAEELLR